MRKRLREIVYPAARRSTGVRRFHGETVADPYDWLGGDVTPEVAAWESAEEALTDRIVDGATRERCEAWLGALLARPHSFRVAERGTQLFFLHDAPGHDQPALYVRDGESAPRLVFNPASLGGDIPFGIAQQSIRPSPDGRHVALAVSPAADAQTILLVETATGRVLEGAPPKTIVPTIDWRGNDGFFYNRNQGGFISGADKMTCAEGIYWHRVGTLFDDDVLVCAKTWDVAHVTYPAVTADGASLFVMDVHLTARRVALALHRLDIGAPVVAATRALLAPGDAFALYLGDAGHESYFQTDLGGVERGRIVAINRDAPEAWRDVVGEGADAMAFTSHAMRSSNAIVSGETIYVTHVRDARHRLAVYGLDGQHLHDVALPVVGSLAGPGGERYGEISVGGDGTSLLFELWTHAHRQLPARYRPDTQRVEWLFPNEIDRKALDVRVEQTFCTMNDGVRVPVFVLDVGGKGALPTLLYGYGGFGASITPEFSPDIPLWLALGGRYVIANIRGGGEYGKAWHEAGRGRNRQRVFDDFCAVAEDLVARGLTTRDTLAIRGISNGGLLTAACAVQRPELFAAAVTELPLLDGLTLGTDPWSQALRPEYGDPVADAQDFEVIRRWSPLHTIKRGADHPPLFVIAADRDAQALRDGARRFVATLQHEAPDALALYRLVRGCGHTGWPRSATVRTIAEEIAFIINALGRVIDVARLAHEDRS
jgi:prolyl oligopeptidase